MANQIALVNRTLGLLNLTGEGEDASADDAQKVVDYLPSKVAELSERGIAFINDTDDFPDSHLQWLAMVLANDLAPEFGKPIDPNAVAFAEQRLRSLNTIRALDTEPRGTYY